MQGDGPSQLREDVGVSQKLQGKVDGNEGYEELPTSFSSLFEKKGSNAVPTSGVKKEEVGRWRRFIEKISYFWSIQPEFRLKVLFLTLTFMFMAACLSIWRPLKVSVFSKIVGASFIPEAKIYGLGVLFPLILLYSKLVDILRRHQLLYCFALFHAFGGVIFYFLLSHPVYGIANTSTSVDRVVGWLFYFFMESFNAFMSTSFWSFANSINKPKDAKSYYGLFVAGSKVGSIVAAGSLDLSISYMPWIKDSILLPNYLLIGSFLLFGAAFFIYLLMKFVPGYYMHGYEAVYQLEKQKAKERKKIKRRTFLQFLKDSFEGLIIILKNPYVLGIFLLIIFYEIMIVMLDYRVALVADASYSTVGGMAKYYARYYLLMNIVGLFISFFGTTPLLKLIGIRKSLFLFPLISIFTIILTFVYPSAVVFFMALVLLRALNYGLNHPVREILYIPTTKSVKFKAKAWSDAFGSRIAKGSGSFVNILLKKVSTGMAVALSSFVTLGMMGIWLVIVYFLGLRLKKALDNREIIGDEVS